MITCKDWAKMTPAQRKSWFEAKKKTAKRPTA